MKSTAIRSASRAIVSVVVALAVSSPGFASEKADRLVVHEWGTFTVLQDAYGSPVQGVNINEETLPPFVHRLAPNLAPEASELAPVFSGSRYEVFENTRGKGIRRGYRLAIMRMETPIIYFYPPGGREMELDVSVGFRNGWLSEWFPEAENKSPGYPEQLGGSGPGTLTWKNLKIGGEHEIPQTSEHVWLAPRRVNSAKVQMPGDGQAEQYLFYRGVAQLHSPVRVVTSEDQTTLNLVSHLEWGIKGEHPVDHLWLADIRPDGTAAFRTLDPLVLSRPPGKPFATTPSTFPEDAYDAENLQLLRKLMHEALAEAGLFEDEATAMLETWELSYFQSSGLRLFFLLPEAWTNYQLPLTMSEPADVTRVMIGRVELVSPAQRELVEKIASGPLSSPDWLTKQVYRLPPERSTELWAALQGGTLSLIQAKEIEIPADYRAYIDLGRFRDAIVLRHAGRNKALMKFAKNYRIAYQ